MIEHSNSAPTGDIWQNIDAGYWPLPLASDTSGPPWDWVVFLHVWPSVGMVGFVHAWPSVGMGLFLISEDHFVF